VLIMGNKAGVGSSGNSLMTPCILLIGGPDNCLNSPVFSDGCHMLGFFFCEMASTQQVDRT
jgi:hypothetical protein